MYRLPSDDPPTPPTSLKLKSRDDARSEDDPLAPARSSKRDVLFRIDNVGFPDKALTSCETDAESVSARIDIFFLPQNKPKGRGGREAEKGFGGGDVL